MATWPSDSTRATSSSRVTSTRTHQLRSERSRVFARASLDPRSVLRRYEPREGRAVVVRCDGSEATPTDRRHDRALGLDPFPGLWVVGGAHELLVPRPHLDR